MKFYLSSYKIGDKSEELQRLVTHKKIGYIPNALDFSAVTSERRKEHIKNSLEELKQLGFDAELLDLQDYFARPQDLEKKLNELKAVWINGGNTFVLRQAMKLSGFDNYIHKHLDDDFVYAGFSAAICVLYKHMKALQIVDQPNELPYPQITQTLWEGLGILDYMLLPHYRSDHPESEAIEQEVEYCKKNNIPYKTLRDGDVLILE